MGLIYFVVKYAFFIFFILSIVVFIPYTFIMVILGLMKLLSTPILRPVVKAYNLIPQRIKDKAKDKAKDMFSRILELIIVMVFFGIPALIVTVSIFSFLWNKINEYDWYIFG